VKILFFFFLKQTLFSWDGEVEDFRSSLSGKACHQISEGRKPESFIVKII
jgi:hypothetical protein